MRFLHTSDLHLGRSFPYALDSQREMGRRDRFKTFERILALGEKRRIDYLFLVGDIFEQDLIKTKEIDFVLASLEAASFQTLLLLGNHDYKLYDAIRARVGEKVYLFQNGELTTIVDALNKVAFHGTSWTRHSYHQILQMSGENLDDGYRHVLLHHGNWTGGDGYFPVDANILNYFDYIALGHVHKPILYENKLQMCGTPEPLDRNDRGKLGVIYGEMSDILSTEYIPLASRVLRHKTLHVDISENIAEDLSQEIREMPIESNAIYSIYLTGSYDSIQDKAIRQALDTKGVPYEIEWARDLPKLIATIKKRHPDDAVGEFLRRAEALSADDCTRLRVCDLGLRALLGEDYD